MSGCADKSAPLSLRVGIPHSDNIQNLEKNYYLEWLQKQTGFEIVPVEIGQTTPTFDLESEPDQTFSTEGITAEQIEDARLKFIGDIKQYPPKYSAIKIKGKRAFDYARSDEEIELKARDIHIEDFKLNTERFPELDFEVTCSKGTYIRSLANDLGKELDNGACLKSLRRTRIGDFKVEDAWQLEDLKQHIIDTGDEFIAMRKAMQEAEQNKH